MFTFQVPKGAKSCSASRKYVSANDLQLPQRILLDLECPSPSMTEVTPTPSLPQGMTSAQRKITVYTGVWNPVY